MADEQYISKHTGEEIDAAVDKATLVIANPNEEATEELTKINIDNTIFSLATKGSGDSSTIFKELLWENSSPTDPFESQIITTKEHNYERFLILAKAYYASEPLLPIYLCNLGSNVIFGMASTETESGTLIHMLKHITITNNSITFYKTVLGSTTTLPEYCLIPLKVYGIK